ncbi:MAG TPA: hypothetical protein VMB47_05770 [Candidatus Aquilonibacter sp.]|nr:hypothetical protein [Candidatus Aquilonibacter sp.]
MRFFTTLVQTNFITRASLLQNARLWLSVEKPVCAADSPWYDPRSFESGTAPDEGAALHPRSSHQVYWVD